MTEEEGKPITGNGKAGFSFVLCVTIVKVAKIRMRCYNTFKISKQK